jgi:hypothetical protein
MCTICYNSCNCYNPVDKVILFLVSDLIHIHSGFIHVCSLLNHAETLCVLEAEVKAVFEFHHQFLMHFPALRAQVNMG